MPRSLFARIVLLLSVGLAAMAVAFGVWIGRTEAAAHVRSVRETALVTTRVEADDAAHYLVVEEYAGLEHQLLAAARIPGVVSLRVVEPDGNVLANVHRESPVSEPRVSYDLARARVPETADAYVEEAGDRLVAWAPIEAGTRLGWLQATWSLRGARAAQASIWRHTLLLGAVWTAVGVVVVLLVLRGPMGAIRELSAFARDLPRRKGERLRVATEAEEIGALADALDHASVELAASERLLVAERERLSVTLQSIAEGVIACDRDGRVMLMNGVAEALTGWTAGDAAGHPFEDVYRIVHDGTGEPLPATLAAAISRGHATDPSLPTALVARDGRRRPVSDTGAPILDPAGKAIGAVVVFRDERARLEGERHRSELETQLRQAQKMEALGHLAGGIAHDFNNLLTGIIGSASLLLDPAAPAGDPRESAQEILEAANRAAALTRGLLAFSRKQRMELRPADLNGVVGDVERMLRRLIGEEIQLQVETWTAPLVSTVDSAQLAQVLMNLATNARDAMPGGGVLRISLRPCLPGDAHVGCADPPLPGPLALLTVADTGVGMDEATRQRIFEPFFTTKEVGKGTGLGLAIVHGIVEQHGGAIRVRSRPGAGTAFELFLPLAAAGAAEAGVEAAKRAPGGSERILLVEDEPSVRRIMRRILDGAGYGVIEATNGAEALDLLSRSAEPPALLVTDVVMPRLSGRELRDAVRGRYPALRVLFVSGYADDVVRRHGVLEEGERLLMKPFGADELLASVRGALDA